MGKSFDPAHMAKLDSPGRRKMLPPEAILSGFSLTEGETMVDVGAGTGFFALPAAAVVGPTGRIVAVDQSEEMVEELARRVTQAELDNISVHVSSGYDFGIGSDIADMVLIATVLHEVDDKPRMLGEALSVLKTGGRVGIVEWRAEEMDRGPRLDERLTSTETISLLQEVGFQSTRAWELNESFYLTSGVK
jgi:ubiquinone/menaquinone biosynthesis C-methylase UbiE